MAKQQLTLWPWENKRVFMRCMIKTYMCFKLARILRCHACEHQLYPHYQLRSEHLSLKGLQW